MANCRKSSCSPRSARRAHLGLDEAHHAVEGGATAARGGGLDRQHHAEDAKVALEHVHRLRQFVGVPLGAAVAEDVVSDDMEHDVVGHAQAVEGAVIAGQPPREHLRHEGDRGRDVLADVLDREALAHRLVDLGEQLGLEDPPDQVLVGGDEAELIGGRANDLLEQLGRADGVDEGQGGAEDPRGEDRAVAAMPAALEVDRVAHDPESVADERQAECAGREGVGLRHASNVAGCARGRARAKQPHERARRAASVRGRRPVNDRAFRQALRGEPDPQGSPAAEAGPCRLRSPPRARVRSAGVDASCPG
ncbi:hypothetical protein [Nannocystis pusilla]|uniref:hypothetical protein n=1 Tax=Nannocystis pusilla TaxID=889268 RepID=UPI003B7E026D